MARYSSIDLFFGIGGIRLRFDRAFKRNIETVFMSEWDEWAAKTYVLNFGVIPPVASGIRKIEAEDIPRSA